MDSAAKPTREERLAEQNRRIALIETRVAALGPEKAREVWLGSMTSAQPGRALAAQNRRARRVLAEALGDAYYEPFGLHVYWRPLDRAAHPEIYADQEDWQP